MFLSRRCRKMILYISSWIRNVLRVNLTMSTWQRAPTSFYESIMVGWKNIFHLFQSHNKYKTPFQTSTGVVVLFWYPFFNLYKISNVYQFSLDFLVAGWFNAIKIADQQHFYQSNQINGFSSDIGMISKGLFIYEIKVYTVFNLSQEISI